MSNIEMKNLGTCAALFSVKLRVEYIDFDESVQKEAVQLMGAARAGAVATRGDANHPQTINPVPGVEPGMQAVFGALCAALFEFTMTGNANERYAKAAALAIYQLKGDRAFIVRGKEEPAGVNTNYNGFPCEFANDALEVLESTEEIKMLRQFQKISGGLS